MSQLELILGVLAAGLVGGVLPLFISRGERVLHLLLSLAAGFFLGTVFLHLLPETFALAQPGDGTWAWVLAGLLAVLALDLGLFGAHHHSVVGWTTLVGLGVHAFTAGLGLGVLPTVSASFGVAMFAHKFGEAFSLGAAMRLSLSKWKPTVLVMSAFALVTPVAIVLGQTFAASSSATVLTALAAGSFLYVAVGDLLPEVFHHDEDRGLKLGLVIVGVLLAGWIASAGHAGHDHGDHGHAGHTHAGHTHAHGAGDHSHGVGLPGAEFFGDVLASAWGFLATAAPFLLLGFLVAGFLRYWLPRGWLASKLGGGSGAIVRAAALGVPLPLCSCSVLPTAIGLRRSGASKSSTVAFLVSTPETGVDSIAVSWALLDPFMTIARPVGALSSALAAGLGVLWSGADSQPDPVSAGSNTPSCGKAKACHSDAPAAEATASCHSDAPAAEATASCHNDSPAKPADDDPACCDKALSVDEPAASPEAGGGAPPEDRSFRRVVRFAYVDLADDILPSLFLGVLLSALIAVFLPVDLLTASWAQGFSGLLLALVLGLPVYVCASASTPIAAALLLQGLSPGAALVFLLVGPATNMASLLVLRRELGTRVVSIYVAAVALTALALGALTNFAYNALELPPVKEVVGHAHGTSLLGGLAAGVLIALFVAGFYRRIQKPAGDAGAASDLATS